MSSLRLDEELDIVCDLYVPYRSQLILITSQIESIFKELLETHAEEFGLTYSNSAYPGHYFYFSPRIKTVKSFREKLVRSNDILEFINLPLREEKLEYLKSLDDLIGLKILGELEEDVLSICSLISSNLTWLSSKGIKIHTDMETLPVLMKNGLGIFKMSCSFVLDGEEFLFELQIKSKLLSAWGDMEHSIFYKDYSGSAIKSSIQKVMNDVGRNLHALDALLFSIRSSNKDYLKQRDSILFLEHIQKFFTNPIKEYMNTTQNFDLNKIVGLLYLFDNIDKKREEFEFPINTIHHIEFEDIDLDEESLKIFVNLKRTSISSRILEFIYTSYVLNDSKFQEVMSCRVQDPIQLQKLILSQFLNEYKKILIKEKSNFKNIEEMYENVKLNEVFDFVFSNGKSEDILFLSNKYIYIFAFFTYINNEYAESTEEVMGQEFKADGMDMLGDPQESSDFYYILVKMFALYVFEDTSTNIRSFLSTDENDDLHENRRNILKISKDILAQEIDDKKSDLNATEYKQLIAKFVNSNFELGSEEE